MDYINALPFGSLLLSHLFDFFKILFQTTIVCFEKGAVISLAVAVHNNEMTASAAHLPSCLASGLAVMMAILGESGCPYLSKTVCRSKSNLLLIVCFSVISQQKDIWQREL